MFGAVSPGHRFVIHGVVLEAAVEDPDQTVAECPQGGVVASLIPLRTNSGTLSADCAVQCYFVIGAVISSACSYS